jgi:hypothetical protein
MKECYDNRIETAMLPTAKTLRRRSSIPFQLIRFANINVRMIQMVLKAHN